MILKRLLLLPATGLMALTSLLPVSGPARGAAPPDGHTLFRQRCSSCHAVEAGKNSVLGPNLAGVVGRKAGSQQFNYTPALKTSQIVWTDKQLDAFLAAPAKMVPGTRMVIGLPDPAQRAAVIHYLASTDD